MKFNDSVWCAAYGASFAIQCAEHIREGRGGATEEDFARFAEEAGAVAEAAVVAATLMGEAAAKKVREHENQTED